VAEGYLVERPFGITTTGESDRRIGGFRLDPVGGLPGPGRQVEADSAEPTADWPAARRAVSTRNGEQET
jgi:hypothetical protein